jgi:hypothetical protein
MGRTPSLSPRTPHVDIASNKDAILVAPPRIMLNLAALIHPDTVNITQSPKLPYS